ncbi:MAG: bifunctional tryptophan synthase trp1 [Chrysothrix sp. TS-e1954]|nr:MAG: bifunctional tryptophan synthase trp1 [Chrysothrix sp. TS-e1954]
MPSLDLIDHSPHHPSPAEPLSNANNLVLIDNYDSFTWNVYQYLALEGAHVTVHRNDKVSLDELITSNPTQLVVSPGPGHPDRDAGISKEAIKYFSGKIPVLGVCMGEQCMYSVFGGKVELTGEILHGKTSVLKHDGKGVYAGLRQGLPVTRYHSLAGTHLTLPDCLEVSSTIAAGPNGQKEVIMGVRHKEYLVEGVQFHPESILTEEGRLMLRNFLHFHGGTWAENARHSDDTALSKGAVNGTNGVKPTTHVMSKPEDKQVSILEKIFEHRRARVAEQKEVPSQRPTDLQAAYEMDLAPPLISFRDRLMQSPYNLSLMAEIKRASPSKGIIAIDTCAPRQALEYALAGASVISVLTEPHWFKGSIDDLRLVRRSLEGMPNRPAILRKEFIFDEYQILEARLAGADTILLIVKMLEWEQLHRLYEYSKFLGMEPLVEVNNVEEMHLARRLKAQVIGVNNRNLVTFDVDLDTTSRLMDEKPADSILCALSGISGPNDVVSYQKNGVRAVLVGEALMRAENTAAFVRDLLGSDTSTLPTTAVPEVLVKICGTRTPDAAKAAVEAGADLIGMILVEGRTRFVPEDTAIAISEVVHSTLKDRQTFSRISKASPVASDYFHHTSQNHTFARHRALLVGVFQNQPLRHVLEQQRLLDLDIVQFHGAEPLEWANLIPVPVIHSFKPGQPGLAMRGYHAMALLDAGAGGSGQSLQHTDLEAVLSKDEELRVFLAGGLEPETVAEKLNSLGSLGRRIVGVDVSSGVEVDGRQDLDKIRAFISAAKAVHR